MCAARPFPRPSRHLPSSVPFRPVIVETDRIGRLRTVGRAASKAGLPPSIRETGWLRLALLVASNNAPRLGSA